MAKIDEAPNTARGRGNIRPGRGRESGRRPRSGRPDYRERLKRPGQRATIPDEILRRLSPDLYRKRTRQSELAAPFTEGSSLSLRDVLRERRAAEQLEFGPQESELARSLAAEQGRTRQQTSNIGNWFAQYKADLERAKASAVQPFQSGMADVQARAGTSQAASDESLKALTAQMQGDAAQRGQTFSGTPAVDASQAEASRRSVADAMTALLQSQGATTGGYFDASKGVAGSAQVGESLREQARSGATVADIGAQRQGLAREKGAFRTDYLGKARERERTSVLENKAFGLDVAKAEAGVEEGEARQRTADAKLRQDQREARRKFRLDKQKLGLAEAKERQRQREAKAKLEFEKRKQAQNRKDRAAGGGTKPETPASIRQEKNRVAGVREKSGEAVQRINDARDDIDRLARTPFEEDGKRRKPTRSEVVAQLRKDGYKPWEISIALQRRRRMPLSKDQIDSLHRAGVRIPRVWLPGSRGADRTGGN